MGKASYGTPPHKNKDGKMDSRETLALYKQGKEGWNEWAKEMLARRDENDPQWEPVSHPSSSVHQLPG